MVYLKIIQRFKGWRRFSAFTWDIILGLLYYNKGIFIHLEVGIEVAIPTSK